VKNLNTQIKLILYSNFLIALNKTSIPLWFKSTSYTLKSSSNMNSIVSDAVNTNFIVLLCINCMICGKMFNSFRRVLWSTFIFWPRTFELGRQQFDTKPIMDACMSMCFICDSCGKNSIVNPVFLFGIQIKYVLVMFTYDSYDNGIKYKFLSFVYLLYTIKLLDFSRICIKILKSWNNCSSNTP